MSTLPTNLRRQLENAIKQARKIAEGGARKALEALAVHEPDPYRHMDEAQRDLRRKLRAQAEQLGDDESPARRGSYEIKHLVDKLAYDQWHRLLFARFLLENNLLISPEHGVSVSLDDCEELAPSLGLKDAWAVAARFAAKELPEIFRVDDPAGAVELPVEDRNPLIHLVTSLPVEVFTANDSLGWCYQFWQAERKDEVNASGKKIGADELPAVTQLFTEDYMVDFLLDNTLGAWHAGKVLAAKTTLAEIAQSEEELRNAVALPGCPWKHLRFIKTKDGKWTPAAGTFDGWPKTTKELTCLDPCMGSGHFVVAMFERVVALRTAEEKLDESVAVAAVISDNLFGLEIDPRCTQIGAFNLALAAWRRVGHCKLPPMNLACSGLAPNAKEEDWLKLAGDNEKLQSGMERLYRLFKDAPVLGSLINPRAAEGNLLEAGFHELQPLLEKALSQEIMDATAHEMVVTAHGLAKAAEILGGQFTLVSTNVPYLSNRKQCDELKDFCTSHYRAAKNDLAVTFFLRLIQLCKESGSLTFVMSQYWLFKSSYSDVRHELLAKLEWPILAKLGVGAFETISGEVVNVMAGVWNRTPASPSSLIAGIDAMSFSSPTEKAQALRGENITMLCQAEQRSNVKSRIIIGQVSDISTLEALSIAPQGTKTGDDDRWRACMWEIKTSDSDWVPYQTTVRDHCLYGGRHLYLDWRQEGIGMVRPRIANLAVGKQGVAISQSGGLPATLYTGERFDSNTAPLIPNDPRVIPALWAYCSSEEYLENVRLIDQSLKVTNVPLIQVPFDLEHWQNVAAEKYPDGLPKPFSSDPTQWLFNGQPEGSDQPLHVAVARLLGFQWPRQTGSSFPDCPALDPDGLEKLGDSDGIVCLSATKGEAPGAERLRALLVQALGKFDLSAIIASAGPKGSKSETLEEWLRGVFRAALRALPPSSLHLAHLGRSQDRVQCAGELSPTHPRESGKTHLRVPR
jgi:hypothetical protein